MMEAMIVSSRERQMSLFATQDIICALSLRRKWGVVGQSDMFFDESDTISSEYVLRSNKCSDITTKTLETRVRLEGEHLDNYKRLQTRRLTYKPVQTTHLPT